jgi:hypothetical protein
MEMSAPNLTPGGLEPARGYNGDISRVAEGTLIDSSVNSEATAVTPAQVVGRDPANPKCCRLALSTDELLGLVVRDPTIYHADASGNLSFGQYRSLGYLKVGYMNATPVEDVNAGDGVVAIFGDGGVFAGLGSTVNGLSATRRLLKGHKWETDTAANASEPGELSALGTNSVNYVTY